MSDEHVEIRGQLHVTLRAVARCYDVRVEWLEEVYDHGLLGRGERVASEVAIAATQLDRVARIVRLHFYDGVNLAGIAVMLRGNDGIGV